MHVEPEDGYITVSQWRMVSVIIHIASGLLESVSMYVLYPVFEYCLALLSAEPPPNRFSNIYVGRSNPSPFGLAIDPQLRLTIQVLNVCNWQELASDPQLFVGGASRLDIQQGDLGEQIIKILAFS